MNCKITSFVLGLLLFTNANAQTMQDTVRAQYDSLQPYVETGLLLDRYAYSHMASFGNYNPLHFEPGSDSTATRMIFHDMLNLFYHAAYDTTVFPFHPDEFDEQVDLAYYGQSRNGLSAQQLLNLNTQADVVLGVMDIEYEMINPMAWDSAYIVLDTIEDKYKLVDSVYYSDTIYLDTLNYSTHPDSIVVVDSTVYHNTDSTAQWSFMRKRAQAFVVATGDIVCLETLNTSVKFTVPTKFRLIHSLMPIAPLWIDYDDGIGYRLTTPGAIVLVNYNSFGTKNIRMAFSIGQPGSDSPYLSAQVEVVHCKHGITPDTTFVSSSYNPCNISMNEGEGLSIFHVKYAPSSNGKLTKPVIIVEGFESTNLDPVFWEFDNGGPFGFGDINWQGFSSGYFKHAPQLELFPLMMDSLLNEGYDVMIMDIFSNRIDIRANANTLIQMIQQVNDILEQNESQEELIIMGASMGSVIARYALGKMEDEGCCHNTSLYCSFAGPQRGANIPLGIQEFLFALSDDMSHGVAKQRANMSYQGVMNSKAARQMLIQHREPTAALDHLMFYTELENFGYPKNCRNIAVTNGSVQGHGQYLLNENQLGPQLQMNDPLITIHAKAAVPRFIPTYRNSVLGLANLISGNPVDPDGVWTLVYLKAFAKHDFETHPSSEKLLLERGRSIDRNVFFLANHYRRFSIGMLAIAINEKVHNFALKIAELTSLFGVCWACPIVEASRMAAQVVIGLIHSPLLMTSWQLNENANFDRIGLSDNNIYNNSGKAYDHVPGDYNITIGRIAELSGGLATTYFPHHAFMTTVSSLGIDTNDLFLDVDLNKDNLMAQNKIPFEAFYFNLDLDN